MVFIEDASMEQVDWLEFAGRQDDVQVAYRLHLPFLFSNWRCLYGDGCPGVIQEGDTTYSPDVGCCYSGAYISNPTDFAEVQANVDKLTEEDIDPKMLKQIRANKGKAGNGWAVVRSDDPDNYNVKTKVKNGACIFANRADGPHPDKLGCAFLHLSARLNKEGVEKVDHTDTMPNVCWQLPFKRDDETDEDGNGTITILPWHVGEWYDDGEDAGGMEWWCVDDSAAYSGGQPVFRNAESELRLLIGSENYDYILPELEKRYAAQYVPPMPHASPEGRTLIPMAIKGKTKK